MDVLQPDITWLGGLTEARRIVAMAAAHDILVVPHGSSVYSYHLQFAFHNCPLAEYINLSPAADKIVPYFGGLFPDEPLPAVGVIFVFCVALLVVMLCPRSPPSLPTLFSST